MTVTGAANVTNSGTNGMLDTPGIINGRMTVVEQPYQCDRHQYKRRRLEFHRRQHDLDGTSGDRSNGSAQQHPRLDHRHDRGEFAQRQLDGGQLGDHQQRRVQDHRRRRHYDFAERKPQRHSQQHRQWDAERQAISLLNGTNRIEQSSLLGGTTINNTNQAAITMSGLSTTISRSALGTALLNNNASSIDQSGATNLITQTGRLGAQLKNEAAAQLTQTGASNTISQTSALGNATILNSASSIAQSNGDTPGPTDTNTIRQTAILGQRVPHQSGTIRFR